MGERPPRRAGAALARYYDLDLGDNHGDVEMYAAMAAAGAGPILELACGTGRVCVPLAAAGHEVVGIDSDPDMLERAQRRWEAGAKSARAVRSGSLSLVQADMLELALGRRFGLVILALNTFLLLPDRARQQRVLQTMAAHLSDGGRAIIDIWLPTPDDLALYDGRLLLDWVRHDDEFDEWVAKTTAASYAPASATAVITSFFDAWRETSTSHRTHRADTVRFISWSELLGMLDGAGLEAQVTAGDYELTAIERDSDRLVVVCAAKRQRGRGPSVGRPSGRRLL